MREQTPDLKTFGRVDGALLHGTALTSPVFKTVLGLWLQTGPTPEEKTPVPLVPCSRSDGVPATYGKVHRPDPKRRGRRAKKTHGAEGISCSSCHLIDSVKENNGEFPAFKINPGDTFFGPYGRCRRKLCASLETGSGV